MHDEEILEIWQEALPFIERNWGDWENQFVAWVREVAAQPAEVWADPEFQRRLWEEPGVSTLGPGNSVTVSGAYTDADVAAALLEFRDAVLPDNPTLSAKAIADRFDALMTMLVPRHSERRPQARLLRLLVTLRPSDMPVLVGPDKIKDVRRYLDEAPRGLNAAGQLALIGKRLAAAVPAQGISAAVRRSILGWYIYDQVVHAGDAPEDAPAGQPATEVPRIGFLPFDQQRKAIAGIATPRETVLRLVRATEHGVERAELVDLLVEEFPDLSPSTLSSRISDLKGLGLIVKTDAGELKPSALGMQLIDNESPGDVMAPVLLGRVFGIAQIFWDLARAVDAMSSAELGEALRARYSKWTSSRTVAGMLAWCTSFGWVEGGATGLRLTESGAYWASGVPESVGLGYRAEAEGPAPPQPGRDATVAEPVFTGVPFERVYEEWPKVNDRPLVLPDGLVAEVHGALHANANRRFALFAGLSGTGKTGVATRYARAYCAAAGVTFEDDHVRVVAVRPDWTDPTGLLGYVNPLGEQPRFEETEAVRFIVRAADNPTRPYFLVLDEMNLARVEHYFAPMLSAMETGGALQIHAESGAIGAVPPSVPWPANLFILGTVNMDETTFSFSDKVLDRAFTFEFWDVDVAAWRAGRMVAGDEVAAADAVMQALVAFAEHLRPVRRHFGYRTCDDVLAYVLQTEPHVGRTRALDGAIYGKVLPKLRGDDTSGLGTCLKALEAVARTLGLERCQEKLATLSRSLDAVGIVRFWM